MRNRTKRWWISFYVSYVIICSFGLTLYIPAAIIIGGSFGVLLMIANIVLAGLLVAAFVELKTELDTE